MALIITKQGDDLYTAAATPPTVSKPWFTPGPLSARQLQLELENLGVHPVDIFDAISSQEPLEKRLPAEQYFRNRELALQHHVPELMERSLQLVTMDRIVAGEPVTILAYAEGSASVLFGKGGGYRGGSKTSPEIRRAALEAVHHAMGAQPEFRPTTSFDLPHSGELYFYARTREGISVASASELTLGSGETMLSNLARAMNKILDLYQGQVSPSGAPLTS